MATKTKVDFTEGKMFKKFLLFVIPIIGMTLLNSAYHAADMMILGLSKDNNAVGAVGTTGQFLGVIINLFIGFSVGVNVVTARCIGSKDEEATRRCVHTAIPMALILGITCTILGIFVAHGVLSWIGVQGEVLELAVRYVKIYFLGTPFNAVYLYLASVCRANGDSKTPLYIGVFSGLLNVGLNTLFVVGLQLTVEGVALATVISQLFSATFFL